MGFLGAAGCPSQVSPAGPVSLNPIPLSSCPSLLLLLPCLAMHTNVGAFSSTSAAQLCIRQSRLWQCESCFCALSISVHALSKAGKGWIMFAVLLPVWLLPDDFGLGSTAEPVGDPWCSGDNSEQEHTGISVPAIASLTSLCSWHPLVSVNMHFPHLFFPSAGCPPPWKKHGRKCYFFSPEKREKDWDSSHAECTAMGSDLVVIESREELVRSNCWGSCSGAGAAWPRAEQ